MVSLVLSALLAMTQPGQDVPVAANGGGTATPTTVTPEEPEADPDPEICRSRLVASTRIGERNRRVQTCKLRSEWAADSRSRLRR